MTAPLDPASPAGRAVEERLSALLAGVARRRQQRQSAQQTNASAATDRKPA
jgi:hypothetical protein